MTAAVQDAICLHALSACAAQLLGRVDGSTPIFALLVARCRASHSVLTTRFACGLSVAPVVRSSGVASLVEM